MEFSFNINDLFEEEISKVDSRLNISPSSQAQTISQRNPQVKFQLMEVIDRMGQASAIAQNLKIPITSSNKLVKSDHTLYIMKDGDANLGKGAIIGLIKMGKKQLFLLDPTGAQFECSPLCLLDFYVHESRQREGCGRKLFNHMLKKENVAPFQLAIDKPSLKCIHFLQKHYKLSRPIPQVNNFIIYDKFFHNQDVTLPDDKKPPLFPYIKKGQAIKSADVLPPVSSNLKKHQNFQSTVLPLHEGHGDEGSVKNMNFTVVSRPNSKTLPFVPRSHFSELNNVSESAHAYGLRSTLYSRHGSRTGDRIFPWQAENPMDSKAISCNSRFFTQRQQSEHDAISIDESSDSPNDEKSIGIGEFPQGVIRNLPSRAATKDGAGCSDLNKDKNAAIENKQPEQTSMGIQFRKTHHYHQALW